MRRWRTHLFVVAALAALTALMTYPLVLNMGDSVTDVGDPLLNTWILAWDVRQITSGTIDGFFDANIFHPHHRTLAYSEHLVPQALVALPVMVITANPVLAYNVVLLLGFLTSGLGMYLLARDLTQDTKASFVAAIVFAFSPFMFVHLPHMQVVTAGGIPLTLLFLHRFLTSESFRDALLAAGFFVIQALANGYYALFLSFFVTLFVAYHAIRFGQWRMRRFWLPLAAAGLLAVTVSGPFFYQYRALQKEMGFAREISNRATLTSYLAASGTNRLWGPLTWSFKKGESALFPGAVALLLAGFGLSACRGRPRGERGAHAILDRPWLNLTGRRVIQGGIVVLAVAAVAALASESGRLSLDLGSLTANHVLAALAGVLLLRLLADRVLGGKTSQPRRWQEEPARFYLLTLLLAVLFSFGKEGPYILLYRLVPGFDGIRAVTRWHIFAILSIAVLAAYGFRALRDRLAGRWRTATTFLPLLLLIEYAAFPVSLEAVPSSDELPEVYHWVASSTGPRDAILELPLPAAGERTYRVECPRVYASAFHWRPIVNGFSGFIPPLYRELQRRWHELPLESNLVDARALGVRFIVLHGDSARPGSRERLAAGLEGNPEEVRLALRTANATVYELLYRSDPSDVGNVYARAPRLPRQGWSVRSSVRDDLSGRAIDGDITTRWASGPQRSGTTFTIDLGRTQSISGFRLRLGSSRSDYPRGYRVELSRDTLRWELVAEDTRAFIPITAYLQPTDLSFDVSFAASNCRYIRITNLEDDPVYYWSIHEIEVFEATLGGAQ